MRCLNPAPASPARACVYAGFRPCGWHHQGLGLGLGDASAGLGLHHQASKKHCFLEGIGGIQARLIFAHFGAKRCRACRRCWALALQNAVNTVKNCCAERFVRFAVAVAGSRAARSLLFSRWFLGLLARARATPATKRCYLRCFVAFVIPGWLAGCSFWPAFSASSGATSCQPSGLGPGWGPESWHRLHHLGLGWATCIT